MICVDFVLMREHAGHYSRVWQRGGATGSIHTNYYSHVLRIMLSKTRTDFSLTPLVVLVLGMITALDAMSIDMYLPALPYLARSLGSSPEEVQLSLSAFIVGLSIGQGVSGPVLDHFGRRWPLLAGLAIFIVGSVLAATTSTVWGLHAARFIQGIGASVGIVAPRAIINDVAERSQSARVYTRVLQVMLIAPVVAPIIGVWLTRTWQWRAVFWCLAVMGVICLVTAFASLAETLKPVEGRRSGRLSFAGYKTYLASAPFVLRSVSGGLLLGPLFIYLSVTPFLMLDKFGSTDTALSLVLAGVAVGLILAGQVNVWLLMVVSEEMAIFIGVSVQIAVGLILFACVRFNIYTPTIYIALLMLLVIPFGLFFGNISAYAMREVSEHAGAASALTGLFQYLVSALIGVMASLWGSGLYTLPVSTVVCGMFGLFLLHVGRETGAARWKESGADG